VATIRQSCISSHPIVYYIIIVVRNASYHLKKKLKKHGIWDDETLFVAPAQFYQLELALLDIEPSKYNNKSELEYKGLPILS
jgi:hypothetical protein